MHEPILITKLHIPELRPNLVARNRLLAVLDRGLVEKRRVTVIAAPAGYGKTTLASVWIRRLLDTPPAALADHPWTAVWVELDEGDNDPARFFLHLIAALRQLDPGAGAATLDLLAAPHLAETAILMTPLINDLAAQPRRILLVFDDCHAVHAERIHAALDFLCRHTPHHLHLVLLTRVDPPLSLATLRGRGLLTEVRMRELRFTSDETQAFLETMLQQPINAEISSALETRTEGWAAGLQLAALSLEGCDAAEVADFAAALRGNDRYIMDYLVEQVMERLPADLGRFLRQVAILQRMCAPLCEHITGRQDSRALLLQAEQANLFLVRLDRQGEWFRFHHLFADLLRLELQEGEQKELHQRAAAWLAEQGYWPEAISHALAAGAYEQAAAWIRQTAALLLRTGELRTLLQWIERLPAPLVQQDAELTTERSLALFFSGKVHQAATAIAALDSELAATAPPAVQGRMFALRAWMAELQGQPEVERLAQTALALAPADDPFARMIALLPLGHTQRAAGRSQAAADTFRIAVAVGQQVGHSFAIVAGLTDLAFSLLEQGLRREAQALCEDGLRQSADAQGQPLPIARLLDIPLAAVHYHAYELDAARQCAERGLQAAHQLLSENILGGDAQRFLALVQFAQGQPDAAQATLEAAQQGAQTVRYRRSAGLLAATQAHLSLRQGDLAAVRRWAASQQFSPTRAPLPGCEFEYCVYAQWLRLENRCAEAAQALACVAQEAAAGGRVGRLIGVRVGQALAAHGLGRTGAACELLAEAVRLAAAEDFRSQFLDTGGAVVPLLIQIRATAPLFIDDLLRRAGEQEAAASSPLVEGLSARELEVLALLAGGLSYREIAQRLVVAQGTVQAHCSNIYGKLGVNNRTEAARRAGELNLLPKH